MLTINEGNLSKIWQSITCSHQRSSTLVFFDIFDVVNVKTKNSFLRNWKSQGFRLKHSNIRGQKNLFSWKRLEFKRVEKELVHFEIVSIYRNHILFIFLKYNTFYSALFFGLMKVYNLLHIINLRFLDQNCPKSMPKANRSHFKLEFPTDGRQSKKWAVLKRSVWLVVPIVPPKWAAKIKHSLLLCIQCLWKIHKCRFFV